MAEVATDPQDDVDIAADVTTVLAWEATDGEFPGVDSVLALVERFTVHGRRLADELEIACKKLPETENARIGADATLSEAPRRLYLRPPAATKSAAGHRAQNIARLVHSLLEARGKVADEFARLSMLASTEGTP
ncbi:DUF6415 family natural product biosynthesis protein [Streptomyces sp. NPDC056296]|uniref:DUF6415 family natural product biosynthesis protein n=1 Tax=Streptomyces sp. NPDC056296 TaxID=3345775 RepID=UPI0035D982C5